jgi:AbrB family looped-hinge helix DNA binding protein
MVSVKMSKKGWVVIPAEYRRRYGLKPGDTVRIVDYGGVLALVPSMKDPIRESDGMLGGSSLTEALLAERTRELARER